MKQYIGKMSVLLMVTLVLIGGSARADENFDWGDAWQATTTGKKDLAYEFHFHFSSDYRDYENGAGGDAGNATFDNHAFEPFLSLQINEYVFGKFTAVYMVGGSPLTMIGQSNPFVVQSQVDVTLPGELFNKNTTLSFGKFIVPFGLENYLHAPPDNLFATRPAAFAVSTTAGGTPGQTGVPLLPGPIWSDVGAWWQQKLPNIGSFDVYVVNGDATGSVNNEVLNTMLGGKRGNNSKSLGGRLQITGLADGLTLSASAITGRYSLDQAQDLQSTRWSGGAEYSKGRWYFIGEYLGGEDELASAVAGMDREVNGWYATLGYEILPKVKLGNVELGRVRLAVRGGQYDSDEDENATTGSAITGGDELSLGLRWDPWKGVYIKTEYQFNGEEDRDIDNDYFGAQIGYFF